MGALTVGAQAPDFSVRSITAPRSNSLSLERSAVVLFICATLRQDAPLKLAFRDDHTDFVEAGAAVVGVVDLGESHRRFAQHHDLPFPSLATQTALRKAYG